jgi:hypothetical protein
MNLSCPGYIQRKSVSLFLLNSTARQFFRRRFRTVWGIVIDRVVAIRRYMPMLEPETVYRIELYSGSSCADPVSCALRYNLLLQHVHLFRLVFGFFYLSSTEQWMHITILPRRTARRLWSF